MTRRKLRHFGKMLGVGALLACPPPDRDDGLVRLGDTALNEDLATLPFRRERVLQKANTYQYDLAALVGHALFPIKDSTGRCGSATGNEFDAIFISPESYVKPDTKLRPSTVNQVIYDHKVSDSAGASLNVFTFAGSLSQSKLAHVTITDAAFLNFPDGSLVPDWKARLEGTIKTTQCPALLIRGAQVRVAAYRFFNRADGNAEFNQAVFGVGGRVYREDDKTQNEVIVTITPILITGSAAEPDTGVTLRPTDTTLVARVLALPDSGAIMRLDLPKLLELRRQRALPR